MKAKMLRNLLGTVLANKVLNPLAKNHSTLRSGQ